MKMTKRNKPYFKALSSLLALLMVVSPTSSVWALSWADATVVSGTASGRTDADITTIVQSTDKAIFNWGGGGFNLTATEVMNLFNGQNGFSLMRDITGNGSSIFGKINAQGNLMIVNAAGVLVNAGAVIDVGGQFQGIAGNVSNDQFFNWTKGLDYEIGLTAGEFGNEGTIKAGQNILLAGFKVINNGIINSAGSITLFAAKGEEVDSTHAIDSDTYDLAGFKGTARVTMPQTAKGGKISFEFIGDANITEGNVGNKMNGVIENKAYTEKDLAVEYEYDKDTDTLVDTSVNSAVAAQTIADAGANVDIVAKDKAYLNNGTIMANDALSIKAGSITYNNETQKDITAKSIDFEADTSVAIKEAKISATAGDVNITAKEGNAYLKKTTIDAAKNARVQGASVTVGGISAGTGTDKDGSITLAATRETIDTATNPHDGVIMNGNLTAGTEKGNVTISAKNGDIEYLGDTEITAKTTAADNGIVTITAENGKVALAGINANVIDVTASKNISSTKNVTAYTGDITMKAGETLEMAAGKMIEAQGANVTVDLTGGKVKLDKVVNDGHIAITATGADSDAAALTVGNIAAYSAPADPADPAINPASATITAEAGSVNLTEGVKAGKVTVLADKNVTVADGKSVVAEDYDLVVVANDGDVTLGGDVMAESGLVEVAAKEGDVKIKGTATADTGIILAALDGDVTAEGAITATGGSVMLIAGNDVETKATSAKNDIIATANGSVKLKGTANADTGSVTVNARNGDVQVAKVDAQNGTISLDAENGLVYFTGDATANEITANAKRLVVKEAKTLTAKDGDVSLTATADVVVKDNAAVNAMAGDIVATAGKGIQVKDGATLMADAGSVTVTAEKKVDVTGSLVAKKNVTATGNTIDIASINADKTVTVTAKGADTTVAALKVGPIANMAGTSRAKTVNLKADNGSIKTDEIKAGTLIAKANVDAEMGLLNIGTGYADVEAETGKIEFTDNVTAVGDIKATAKTDITFAGKAIGATVTAMAGNDITASDLIKANVGDVTLTADNDITVDVTKTDNGTIAMYAGNDLIAGTTRVETSGDIEMTAGNDISVGTTATAAGDVMMIAENKVTVADGKTVAANGGNLGVQTQTGDIVLGGDIRAANNVVVVGGANVTVKGNAKGENVGLFAGNDSDAGTLVVDGTVTADNKVYLSAADDLKANSAVKANGDYVYVEAYGKATLNDVEAANGEVDIYANDIDLQGNLTAKTMVSAEADNDLTVAEGKTILASQGLVDLQAGNDMSLQETIALDGTITAKAGNDLALNGNVAAKDEIKLEAGNDLTVADGKLVNTANDTTPADITMTAGNKLTAQATSATGALTMKAKDVNAKGNLTAKNAVKIDAENDIKVDSDVVVESTDSTVAMTAGNNIRTRQTKAKGDITLTAQTGDLTTGRNETSEGNIALEGNGVTFTGQQLATAGGIKATAKNGDMLIKQKIEVAKDAELVASGKVTTENNIQLNAGENLKIQAGDDVDFASARANAGNNLTVAANGDVKAGRMVTTTGDITVDATGAIEATKVINAGNDLVLNGTEITAAKEVTAANDATMTASEGNISFAKDVTANSLDATAQQGDITSDGTITTEGNAKLVAANDITVGDVISSQAEVSFTAGNDITAGETTAAADVTMKAGNDINIGKTTATDGKALFEAEGKFTGTGDITANQDVTVSALGGAAVLGGATTSQDGNVKITASEEISTAAITAKDDVFMRGAKITTGGQVKASNGAVTAEATGATGIDGDINLGGYVLAKNTVALTAANNIDQGASTVVVKSDNGEINLDAGNDINLTRLTATEGSVYAEAENDITLKNVQAKGNIALLANNNLETSGTVEATEGDVIMLAAKDLSANKTVATAGDIKMTAGNDLTAKTTTADAGNIEMIAGNNLKATTTTAAAGDIEMTAGNNLTANTTKADAGDIEMGAKKNLVATTTEATAGSVEMGALEGHVKTGDVTANEGIEVTAATTIRLDGDLTTTSDIEGADVKLVAGGRIIQTEGKKITTADLDMTAGTSIGADDDKSLATAADTINALATKGISITEDDDVTIKGAENNGTGNIKIETLAGSMTLDENAKVKTTDGNIYLKTDDGDIDTHVANLILKDNARVEATGFVELFADGDLTANEGATKITSSGDGVGVGADGDVTLWDATIEALSTGSAIGIYSFLGNIDLKNTHVTADSYLGVGAVDTLSTVGGAPTHAGVGDVTIAGGTLESKNNTVAVMGKNVAVKDDANIIGNNTAANKSGVIIYADATDGDLIIDNNVNITAKAGSVNIHGENAVAIDNGVTIDAQQDDVYVVGENQLDIAKTTIKAGSEGTYGSVELVAGNMHGVVPAATTPGTVNVTDATVEAKDTIFVVAATDATIKNTSLKTENATDADGYENLIGIGGVNGKVNLEEVAVDSAGVINVFAKKDNTITKSMLNANGDVDVYSVEGNVDVSKAALASDTGNIFVRADKGTVSLTDAFISALATGNYVGIYSLLDDVTLDNTQVEADGYVMIGSVDQSGVDASGASTLVAQKDVKITNGSNIESKNDTVAVMGKNITVEKNTTLTGNNDAANKTGVILYAAGADGKLVVDNNVAIVAKNGAVDISGANEVEIGAGEGGVKIEAENDDVWLVANNKLTIGDATKDVESLDMKASGDINIGVGDIVSGIGTGTTTTPGTMEMSNAKVEAGNDITAVASTDATFTKSDLTAGNIINVVGFDNVKLTTVDASAGDRVNVFAGKGITVEDNSKIVAGNDIVLNTFVPSAALNTEGSITVDNSTLTANNNDVTITAAKDVTLNKATVEAGLDIDIDAGTLADGDLTITDSELNAIGQDITLDVNGNPMSNGKLNAVNVTATAGRHVLAKAEGVVTLDNAQFTAQDNLRVESTDNGIVMKNGTALRAEENATVLAKVDIQMKDTSKVTAKEDVLVMTENSIIKMDKDALIESDEGDVGIKAGGEFTVGHVKAKSDGASIDVIAGYNILRADTTDTEPNFEADYVALTSEAGNIGKQEGDGTDGYISVLAKWLSVGTKSTTGMGDVYLNSLKPVELLYLGGNSVNRVESDGSLAASPDEWFEASTSADTLAVETTGDFRLNVEELDSATLADANGTALTITDEVQVGGDMAIVATTGDIEQNADIDVTGDSAAGNATIAVADGDFVQNADVTAKNDLAILASDNIKMADDTKTETTEGNVQLHALTGDIEIEKVVAQDGNVLVQAEEGKIVDIDNEQVNFDSNGVAQNLDEQETDIEANNIALFAKGDIGEGGQMTDSTNGLDVKTNTGDGVVSATSLEGDIAIASPEGDLKIGDIAADELKVDVVDFSSTGLNNGGAAGEGTPAPQDNNGINAENGTANIAAAGSILDGNGGNTDITAENVVFTAGESVGGEPGNVDALELDLTGTGENLIWGNSTKDSSEAVVMNVAAAPGANPFPDAGAKKNSKVIFLMDGRYHGGDTRFYNEMALIHAAPYNDLSIFTSDQRIFDNPDMINLDFGILDDLGARYRKMMRPSSAVKIIRMTDDEEKEEELPFETNYNPDEAVQAAVK